MVNTRTNADIIEEYKNRLDGDISIFADDYICYDFTNSNYFDDIISEYADNNTSIYYCDIAEFIAHNPDALNDAVAEFGIDSRNFDIYALGQQAEYLTIRNELFRAKDDIIAYAAAVYADEFNIDLTIDDNRNIIDDIASVIYFDSHIYEIADAVKEYFEIEI